MIVVFGSINLDFVFAVGSLPRPGETVLAPEMRLSPGGKGANQAVAAAKAGAAVAMFGCVGQDAFADPALSGLREAGVELDGVVKGHRTTGCAVVIVGPDGENQITVAAGANADTRAAQVPDDRLDHATTLLLQQEVPARENAALARRAKAGNARVILNAAPAARLDKRMLSGIDILVVNEGEARALAGYLSLDTADAAGAAKSIAELVGITAVLTLGRCGALAWTPKGTGWSVDSLAIAPRDTTGAGDAFCGYLSARLDGGDDMPTALRWASVAGGLACLSEGAQEGIPVPGAVAEWLSELGAPRRLD